MTEEEFEAVGARAYQVWDREHRPQGRDEAHFAPAREWDATEEDQ